MNRIKIVVSITAVALGLIHLIILTSYTALCFHAGIGVTAELVGYWLAAVVVSGLITAMITGRPRRAKPFLTAGGAVAAVALAGALVWCLRDDPPVSPEYTEADLRLAQNDSYRHLAVFSDQDKLAALDTITDRARDPNQAAGDSRQADTAWVEDQWRAIADFRAAVEALAGYDVLCDLPEDSPIDSAMTFLRFAAIRKTGDIYQNYALACLQQGEPDLAAAELDRFYTFSRKTMEAASIVLNKIIFMAITDRAMSAAYELSRDERCPVSTALWMQRRFTPLTLSECSFERAFKGEYLFAKNTMHTAVTPSNFLDTALVSDGRADRERSWPVASRLAYYLGYKPNMNDRFLKHLCDLAIAAQERRPPDFQPVRDYCDRYENRPPYRNMAGWILNRTALPDFECYVQRCVRLKVKSDLLAMAVSHKTGRPRAVEDYFTGGALRYRLGADALRHPGADGAYDTEDDIVLSGTTSSSKG